jgi:hypothetical protein
MKSIVLAFCLLLVTTVHAETAPGYQLPENGKIKTAILSGSYSCKDSGAFKTLNLDGETHHNGNYYNELQINFACGSDPELEGTDLSLIAEIGNIPLENMDYYSSLSPKHQVGESHNFRKAAPLHENMTYAMVLNTFKYRGLLAFRVISYRENILTIEYVTRNYSKIRETETSTFIDYAKRNFR